MACWLLMITLIFSLTATAVQGAPQPSPFFGLIARIFNPGLAGQKKPCNRSDGDCDDYYEDDDDDCCRCEDDHYDRVLQVLQERKGGKKCKRKSGKKCRR